MTAKQLTDSILQLAIQGKLVPQAPNDEPASVLLDRIREEKKRLVKEGKLKKKDLEETPISEDEIPFEIPESWEWVCLGDLCAVKGGKRIPVGETFSESPTNHIYIRVTDMKNHTLVKQSLKYISDKLYERLKQYTISKDDLYLTIAGTIGDVGDVPEEFDGMNLTENAVKLAYLQAYKYYLLYAILSPLVQAQFVDKTKQMAQPKLAIERIKTTMIPLPPINEQHRIVEKLEGVKSLFNEYGSADEELSKLNAELPEKLKKSILQEAIMGKLGTQDPNDEPASVLLDRIREEKKALVKAGVLKKKDLVETPVSEDEKSFDIPENWVWCRLGDLGVFERGNGIKRDETTDCGYPCVRYGEMYTKYRQAPTFDKTISFTTLSVFEKCRKAHKGDLFMALTGENKQDIALAAQYIGDEEIAVGGDLCHFSMFTVYALYFVYLINSKFFSSKKESLATGDIIIHISADKLGSIAIPLPPLAEQHRIVEKIEALFAEVDHIEI